MTLRRKRKRVQLSDNGYFHHLWYHSYSSNGRATATAIEKFHVGRTIISNSRMSHLQFCSANSLCEYNMHPLRYLTAQTSNF
jgi:hypothetical protein